MNFSTEYFGEHGLVQHTKMVLPRCALYYDRTFHRTTYRVDGPFKLHLACFTTRYARWAKCTSYVWLSWNGFEVKFVHYQERLKYVEERRLGF